MEAMEEQDTAALKETLPDESRRKILKAAVAAGAAIVVATAKAPTRAYASAERAVKGARWAVAVDLSRCIGCRSCTVACKAENEVSLGVFRTYVHYLENGQYPNTKRYFAPTLCNHCSNPPCVPVCPVDPVKATYKRPDGVEITYEKRATYKRPDGVVLVDEERCIGCHLCVQNCPYGARFVDPVKKAGGNPTNNTVGKCTYCVHRLDQGLAPSCVQTCVGGALVFGDVNDPSSEISQRLKTAKANVWKPEKGTKPNTYYMGLANKAVLGEEVTSL